jgi:hypothetical protein
MPPEYNVKKDRKIPIIIKIGTTPKPEPKCRTPNTTDDASNNLTRPTSPPHLEIIIRLNINSSIATLTIEAMPKRIPAGDPKTGNKANNKNAAAPTVHKIVRCWAERASPGQVAILNSRLLQPSLSNIANMHSRRLAEIIFSISHQPPPSLQGTVTD